MKLMEIRDSQFPLLLQKPPGGASTFPIVYSMRWWVFHHETCSLVSCRSCLASTTLSGEKWGEMTIVLVGALSRYVNQLEDGDCKLSKEQAGLVKHLRV